jgi:hypothetical protein
LLLVLALLAVANALIVLQDPIVETDENGEQIIRCATEEVWELKKMMNKNTKVANGTCTMEGSCDDPRVRDATPLTTIMIPVVLHIFKSRTGVAPKGKNGQPIDANTIAAQMNTLQGDLGRLNLNFRIAQTFWHQDNLYDCIAPFSTTNLNWLEQIMAAKEKYAVNPSRFLNVYVMCQRSLLLNPQRLMGMGTFPWDEEALFETGGLWLNAVAFGAGGKTMSHELGHNFGLYHTFHGVTETEDCTDPCTENVHPVNDPAADRVGDFCSDTAATPINFNCAAPPTREKDCKGAGFGLTDFRNIMGYLPTIVSVK